jgi:RNA polymerase sigma-70 factor, ECF subfamily
VAYWLCRCVRFGSGDVLTSRRTSRRRGAALAELRRRSLPVILEDQQQDDLAHQAGDDALLAITSKLDRFRRESRFAPWADKFVMLEVSAKLGRHYWRNPPVPMSGDA